MRRRRARPTVGLALSGGGIRGLAHIGVLRALRAHGVPIDYISGTSAGAIVAALYACGYSVDEIEALARRLEPSEFVDFNLTVSDFIKFGLQELWHDKKRFWAEVPKGLVKGKRIERYFDALWGEQSFRDTRIPLAVTAVDVYTADTVFFVSPCELGLAPSDTRYDRSAMIAEAVRASIAIPGVFFPKEYRGMLLVDGAVKNNLPTDILREMGADIVLGVDLGYNGAPCYDVRVTGEVLLRTIDIINRELTLLKGAVYADHVFRPAVESIGWSDTKKALAAIEIGAKSVEEDWPSMKKIFRRKMYERLGRIRYGSEKVLCGTGGTCPGDIYDVE
ncbi:MAG: patatin-like phospholipase family protein [Selenomonadales bacterium]|nr:patatin-like phospholipase family protein [Selenomonadales bacterium]